MDVRGQQTAVGYLETIVEKKERQVIKPLSAPVSREIKRSGIENRLLFLYPTEGKSRKRRAM
jgi:hypothetical protein